MYTVSGNSASAKARLTPGVDNPSVASPQMAAASLPLPLSPSTEPNRSTRIHGRRQCLQQSCCPPAEKRSPRFQTKTLSIATNHPPTRRHLTHPATSRHHHQQLDAASESSTARSRRRARRNLHAPPVAALDVLPSRTSPLLLGPSPLRRTDVHAPSDITTAPPVAPTQSAKATSSEMRAPDTRTDPQVLASARPDRDSTSRTGFAISDSVPLLTDLTPTRPGLASATDERRKRRASKQHCCCNRLEAHWHCDAADRLPLNHSQPLLVVYA